MGKEKLNRNLIADIRPLPVKKRAEQGKVTITLGTGDEVTLVGLVYGLERSLKGNGFDATIFLDHYNQRIRILDYHAKDHTEMILAIRAIAEANGFDKIICYAHRSDWQNFLSHGYVLEAVLKYFYGSEDAFIVSKFRSQERLTSGSLMDEIFLIEKIMESPPLISQPRNLPGYVCRKAVEKDIPDLVTLYRTIFESYPSPLIHEDYLKTVFQKESLFTVVTLNGIIVAAASAELHPANGAAELTDCATRPDERGKGLMSIILSSLEQQLLERKYRCAYTLARARSFGMNQVFYHLGYEFMGRLVNNCDIYGAYEDMNLWVRSLVAESTPSTKNRATSPKDGSGSSN